MDIEEFLKNKNESEKENTKEYTEKPKAVTIKPAKPIETYIQIAVSPSETDMIQCLEAYNKLYATHEDLLNWDIRKLTIETGISPVKWRNFLLDSRIQKWMADEQFLKMQTKRNELLEKVGDNNSTATVQALTTIMKATDDDSDRLEDNKVYIYSFMPLTNEEERLNNAQVLDSIPAEVRAGMQHISFNKNRNN